MSWFGEHTSLPLHEGGRRAATPSRFRARVCVDYLRNDLKPARTSSEKKLRLFPCGEMTALRQRVVVNELRIRLFRPAPETRIEFVREDAHGNRDLDAFGPKNASLFSQ